MAEEQELVNEKKIKIDVMLVCLIVSYVILAVGLFFLVFRHKVIPQNCSSTGACVDLPGQARMETLIPSLASWIIIGVGAVGAVIFTILKTMRKKDNESKIDS